MWNPPSDAELRRIPALYSTQETPWREKLIYEHFFIGGCDWYVAEYSPFIRGFFGFAILNEDLDNAEWGNISYDELRAVRIGPIEIDRDLHWKIRKASEVEKIVAAHEQQGARIAWVGWRTSRGHMIGDPPANYLEELAEAGIRYRTADHVPPDVRERLDALYREGLGRPAHDGDIRDLLDFCSEDGGDAPCTDERGSNIP